MRSKFFGAAFPWLFLSRLIFWFSDQEHDYENRQLHCILHNIASVFVVAGTLVNRLINVIVDQKSELANSLRVVGSLTTIELDRILYLESLPGYFITTDGTTM